MQLKDVLVTSPIPKQEIPAATEYMQIQTTPFAFTGGEAYRESDLLGTK